MADQHYRVISAEAQPACCGNCADWLPGLMVGHICLSAAASDQEAVDAVGGWWAATGRPNNSKRSIAMCNCAEQLNEALEGLGFQVAIHRVPAEPVRPILAVMDEDGFYPTGPAGQGVVVACIYCPFCGRRLVNSGASLYTPVDVQAMLNDAYIPGQIVAEVEA